MWGTGLPTEGADPGWDEFWPWGSKPLNWTPRLVYVCFKLEEIQDM